MRIDALSICVGSRRNQGLTVAAIRIDPMRYPRGSSICSVAFFGSWSEFFAAIAGYSGEGEPYALSVPWFIQAEERVRVTGKVKIGPTRGKPARTH